ncbi:CPBP family intramembrane glutamic endopeptidase [Calycomorphotria hydatis]|uniref:CPBP family intramembrane glutamic endopeptidase n=1 Tax=Calycomorphotria hydatis TaxID=2528027 RepID=UPI0011A73AC5|nr:CPBP family intramembrane glutamic endopeptidase [Calycomorphotria hydatis]
MQLPTDISWQNFAMLMFIGVLFSCSAATLRAWWKRSQLGKPPLPLRREERSKVHFLPVGICLAFWLFTILTNAVTPDTTNFEALANKPVEVMTAMISVNTFLCGLLLLCLYTTNRGQQQFQWRRIPVQLRDGFLAFSAQIIPTMIVMVLTIPIRPEEKQHPLLLLMYENPEPTVIVLVAASVLLSAPLTEELMFRVILQRWLVTMTHRRWFGILAIAVGFALVHGWRDALPLMPLAITLGWLYEQRNSFLSIVLVHFLFNSTFLILALLAL